MAAERKRVPESIRRERALTFVAAKYKGRRCDFARADCIRMARSLLVKLGRRPPPLPRYSSGLGARKALKAAGHASVTGLLDSMLRRIPPAMMRLGDLAAVPGKDGIEAVFAYAGGNKYFGWSEQNECAEPVYLVLDGNDILAAWSVL